MDAVYPFLYSIGSNVVGIEVGKAETDCTVFVIRYKNKIAPDVNRIRF